MTIILNLATIICGLSCTCFAFAPQVGVGVRVFWAVVGFLAILRGVL